MLHNRLKKQNEILKLTFFLYILIRIKFKLYIDKEKLKLHNIDLELSGSGKVYTEISCLGLNFLNLKLPGPARPE